MIQIFLITFFFSFGVQFIFYLYYKYTNHKILIHKAVVHYSSGIIGDGVLVPALNVFCSLTLEYLNQTWDKSLLPYSFLGGVIITFIFHYYQQALKLTNWTMPEVGKWNLLGGYHAIFMFFESSFLVYSLVKIIQDIAQDGIEPTLYSPLKYSLLVLLAFAVTFLYDYRRPLKITT